MPYLSPSPSPRTSPTRERGTEEGPERPTHRRTRSATPTFTYSTESGTTAFSPLPGLPRRQRQFEKKPLFQIAPDEDEEGESTRTESLSRPQEQPTFQAPGPQLASSSPSVSYVPFPSSVRGFCSLFFLFSLLYSFLRTWADSHQVQVNYATSPESVRRFFVMISSTLLAF